MSSRVGEQVCMYYGTRPNEEPLVATYWLVPELATVAAWDAGLWLWVRTPV